MKYGSKKSNIVIAILLFIIAAVFFCYGIYMVNYSMEYIRMYMNISTITFEDALQYVISSSSSYIGFAILMFAGGFIIFSLRKRYPAAAAISDDSDNDDDDDHDEYDDDDHDDGDAHADYETGYDKDYAEDISAARDIPKSRPADTPVPEDRTPETEDRSPEAEVTDDDAPLKDENIGDDKDKTDSDIDEPTPSEEPADKSPEPERPVEKRSAEKRPAAPATMNEAPAVPKGSSIEASADIPVEAFTRPEPAAPKRNVTYKDVVIAQSAPRESRPAVDTVISHPELTSDSWVKDFLRSH